MAASPTQRSLQALRKAGYTAETVEKWIPGANIRRDLFGFLDILAIRDGDIVGVQATTASNLAARVAKAEALATYELVCGVMRVEFHGWKKVGRRWQCVVR